MPGPSIVTLVRNRAVVSWLILIAATGISFAVGVEHATGSMVVLVVLAIATFKMRLVGLDFMGLRHAPIPLRAAFEAYCLALFAALSCTYLWL
jgi:Prokaryotic Cytochrome C oxidase subunit IV